MEKEDKMEKSVAFTKYHIRDLTVDQIELQGMKLAKLLMHAIPLACKFKYTSCSHHIFF